MAKLLAQPRDPILRCSLCDNFNDAREDDPPCRAGQDVLAEGKCREWTPWKFKVTTKGKVKGWNEEVPCET